MRGQIGGKYVYGIVSRDRAGTWHDDAFYAPDADQWPRYGRIGIGGKPVYTIAHRDLGAIVSSMPFDWAKKIKGRIDAGDKSNLDFILAHQKVIEAARSAGLVVLPVRFGAVLTDENVKRLLVEKYGQYRLKAARFSGKDEYGVRLLAGPDMDARISKLVEHSPDVERLRAEIQSQKGQGTAYFANLKLNDLIRTRSLRAVDELAREIHGKATAVAEAAAELSKDTSNTIFNRAYLIDSSRAEDFNSTLDSIRDSYARFGIELHSSGPWAPYSFCSDDLSSFAEGRRQANQHRVPKGRMAA